MPVEDKAIIQHIVTLLVKQILTDGRGPITWPLSIFFVFLQRYVKNCWEKSADFISSLAAFYRLLTKQNRKPDLRCILLFAKAGVHIEKQQLEQ